MSQPYIGEIRMFAGNFAPLNWMLCQGQVLPISQYDTLYNLIGTTYGGNGQTTFALPNLQGRLPLHQTGNYPIGLIGGSEQVTLITQQLPVHSHPMAASQNNATSNTVTGNVVGSVGATQIYREVPAASAMANQACSLVGGNQPHDNMQPYLCINFIIALFGVYPSQS
ncbi:MULTISPECIES: tail fiber protein [Bradyrhizobium]|jgi:microcystin-dependent protein|uniref:phage tail protein n=1 Tax=Bradyrhizobium TaxID=374 RepID=UPI000426B6B5|nr:MULTISPECIES: tail fiber protein [Bradyrhizobium]AUC94382.1 phage tail protein [Bradyrhizobium sp. SK17]KIU48921.1 tail collar protein [Bradyrhizobium elkanii]MBK5650004.1 phage tail protein [Rhizobium sp.]OCX29237.1 phage tail protein [Bradyrhizobium sp. UASWS1016]